MSNLIENVLKTMTIFVKWHWKFLKLNLCILSITILYVFSLYICESLVISHFLWYRWWLWLGASDGVAVAKGTNGCGCYWAVAPSWRRRHEVAWKSRLVRRGVCPMCVSYIMGDATQHVQLLVRDDASHLIRLHPPTLSPLHMLQYLPTSALCHTKSSLRLL